MMDRNEAPDTETNHAVRDWLTTQQPTIAITREHIQAALEDALPLGPRKPAKRARQSKARARFDA